ncbi:MAG: VOC family protein [bacterium]
MRRELEHINYTVPNIEKTVSGYKKLGFEVIGEFELHRKFVFISNGIVTYELFEDPSLNEAYIGHVAYKSENVQEDYDLLLKQGVEMITPVRTIDGLFENGMEFFLFKGPNNEILEFCRKK